MIMKAVVDVGQIRNNIKDKMKYKLFNWIDIRNEFQNYGITILEDILKFEKIGLISDDLSAAVQIRNVNKIVPIIVTKIKNMDQIYDIIMNNLILSIDDMDMFNDLCHLKIQDPLQIAIRIDINNYEDGISSKNYLKIKEHLKSNKNIFLYLLYAKTNDNKYNNLEQFRELVRSEQASSFIIGKDVEFTSDGYLFKEVFANSLTYKITISKCYKLIKGTLFVNTKVKKDCYGIKIIAQNIDLTDLKKLKIDQTIYKAVYYNEDTLFLIGNEWVKSGRTIDLPKEIKVNNYFRLPIIYKLNDKTTNFNIFK